MAKPAYIILASSGGKLLGSFGPYRSEKRAEQVRQAVHRSTLGSPEAVQVERLTLAPGVLTPGKAADYIGPLVWGDVWSDLMEAFEEGSTSDEPSLPPLKEEEA